ncbi:MAG: hypothetical protein LBB16_03440 [Puniceicoccales bacterium]|jgi:hypothetical protein|nr:hypothetical protein [Puniceicoccales bacterium]
MKKLLGIAVGILGVAGLCAEGVSSDLTLDTGIKFQTDRVFRGRNEFGKALAPQVKVGYQCCEEASIYVGVDTAISIQGGSNIFQHISPYLGALWDVTEVFTLEAGYKHHFYTTMGKQYTTGEPVDIKRCSNEIYAGVTADVLLEPSLYCFYDFDRKEVAIEGRVGYNFDLSQYSISGLGINLGAKLGYDYANKPYGYNIDVSSEGKKNYCYYGVNADLVYELNNNAKAKFGLAYEGNSAKKESWVNNILTRGHKNSLWLNASVDCAF